MKLFFAIILISISWISGLGCSEGRAETLSPREGLTRFFEESISAFDQAAIDGSDLSEPNQLPWELKAFSVRLDASAGLDLPWIAQLQLIPEAEFVWE